MLIPSKLSRPVRLDHTVVRERLLAKLCRREQLPAGADHESCGLRKDHLISQWAAGKNNIGWYSLDEGDNQQEHFRQLSHCRRAAGNQRSLCDM
ncbi:hypothetical protein ACLB1S_28335 [Escherichia coli]